MSKIGFVYKLMCNNPEISDFYIGSTDNLRKRKYQHKQNCNHINSAAYNFYVYQFIRNNGGFENWNISQIDEVKYDTKNELHARERFHIDSLNASLNKKIPTKTQKERNEENKEELKIYFKNRYETDKVNFKNLTKQRYELKKDEIKEKASKKKNCVCGGRYTHSHITTHLKSQRHVNYLLLIAEPESNNTA